MKSYITIIIRTLLGPFDRKRLKTCVISSLVGSAMGYRQSLVQRLRPITYSTASASLQLQRMKSRRNPTNKTLRLGSGRKLTVTRDILLPYTWRGRGTPLPLPLPPSALNCIIRGEGGEENLMWIKFFCLVVVKMVWKLYKPDPSPNNLMVATNSLS